jgi:hypothetical protein
VEGAAVGLRERLKKVERKARGEAIEIRQLDGTSRRFYEADYIDCLVHEYERGQRHYDGEEPGPAHPLVEALRGASEEELGRLASEHGTILGLWLGEDEVIRGERERTGSPVWETSPGAYE